MGPSVAKTALTGVLSKACYQCVNEERTVSGKCHLVSTVSVGMLHTASEFLPMKFILIL